MERALVGGAVCLLALASAGCGKADDGAPTAFQDTAQPAAATEVHVHLDEWTIEPDVAVIDGGPVMLTFEGHNHGGIPHQLIILKTDRDADKLPVVSGKVDVAAVGEKVGEIEVDELPPGATVSHMFDLDPGRYVLICNIAGHYGQGMYASLTIE